MGKKKYTRKQLRQPDEFITMSHRAAEYVKDHAKLVLVSIGVAAVIIAVAWTWTWYKENKDRDATAVLSRAIEIYGQMVMPGAKEKLKPREDGIPRFETTKAKLKATEEELSKAIDKYKSKPIGLLALAMRAAVRYDEGDYAKAAADYEKYLAEASDKRFHPVVEEGLLYCYEAQKKWDKAMAQVKKLGGKGTDAFQQLYHEGRILAEQGKKKEAVERFEKIVKGSASATLQRRAGQRLALLN